MNATTHVDLHRRSIPSAGTIAPTGPGKLRGAPHRRIGYGLPGGTPPS